MTTDRASVRFPPPLLFVFAVLIGVAAQRWIGAPLDLAWGLRIALAVPLAIASGYFAIGAVSRFRATGQDERPWTPTPSLIVTGIYRSSRNPMYVAMGLLQGVAGVLLANVWVLILVPASYVAVYLIAVRHEEAYLSGKFGSDYEEYRQRVRRWI